MNNKFGVHVIEIGENACLEFSLLSESSSKATGI
jgi:hypothetical protein